MIAVLRCHTRRLYYVIFGHFYYLSIIPAYFDVVELHTKVIIVMILLKVAVFISELLETILVIVLTMDSIWSWIEPIIENPDLWMVCLPVWLRSLSWFSIPLLLPCLRIRNQHDFARVEFWFDFLVFPGQRFFCHNLDLQSIWVWPFSCKTNMLWPHRL
jgi:hypothetical protein